MDVAQRKAAEQRLNGCQFHDKSFWLLPSRFHGILRIGPLVLFTNAHKQKRDIMKGQHIYTSIVLPINTSMEL
jgi:hypothetical protein